MNFLRAFCVTSGLGFCGYLYQSIKYKDKDKSTVSITYGMNNKKIVDVIEDYSQPPTRRINQDNSNSLTKKWRNNLFKVNAKLENSACPEQLGTIEPPVPPDVIVTSLEDAFVEGFYGDIVIASNTQGRNMPKLGRQNPHPLIETRSVVTYNDYVVVCDSITKSPCFALQSVTRENVNDIEHRHCESFKFGVRMPSGYYFGQPDFKWRLNIERIIPVPPPFMNVGCSICMDLYFWKTFHKYLKFLSKEYDHLIVCSGAIFQPEHDGDCSDLSGEEWTASHYYKIIFCKNDSNQYRLECYILKNEPTDDAYPDLKNYLTSREYLESQTGFKFFPNIPSKLIKYTKPHKYFKSPQPSKTKEYQIIPALPLGEKE